MHSGMLGAAIVRIADMVERVEGLERRLEQLVRENMQLLDDSRRYEAEAYEATELARRLARADADRGRLDVLEEGR
jgi:predicted nuclease with TOPRIM domain